MKLIDADALFKKVASLKKYLLVEPYTAKHIEYGYYADDILAAIHQMPEVNASSATQERIATIRYERYATAEQITQGKEENTMQNERAIEIAERIRNSDTWDFDLLEELCDLAGMAEEWAEADAERFESVAYAAADKLNVEII